MFITSHTSSKNIKRVGNDNCKKSNIKHSFEDRKKMCKEKLNTLTDCTGVSYNIQSLRRNIVYVTKYWVNEYGRVQICSQKQMKIDELENYVNIEYKRSFPSVDHYHEGYHEEQSLVHKEDK